MAKQNYIVILGGRESGVGAAILAKKQGLRVFVSDYEKIPDEWKKQLKINGKIVAPVENSIVVIDKIGKKEYAKKEYFGFSFVPLITE